MPPVMSPLQLTRGIVCPHHAVGSHRRAPSSLLQILCRLFLAQLIIDLALCSRSTLDLDFFGQALRLKWHAKSLEQKGRSKLTLARALVNHRWVRDLQGSLSNGAMAEFFQLWDEIQMVQLQPGIATIPFGGS